MVWRRAVVAGRLVLFLCSQSSGRLGSRKACGGLATKLHPHLIALGWYVGTEIEQQKRIEARERRQRERGRGREREVD